MTRSLDGSGPFLLCLPFRGGGPRSGGEVASPLGEGDRPQAVERSPYEYVVHRFQHPILRPPRQAEDFFLQQAPVFHPFPLRLS